MSDLGRAFALAGAVHGNILAVRTGSADYSHLVLASGWVRAGYKSIEGRLCRWSAETCRWGQPIAVPEEADLFRLIGIPMPDPRRREFRP